MKPAAAVILFLVISSFSYCQDDFLLVKKGKKTINRLWKGSVIAFQTENKVWYKGEITRIKNDSVYILPKVVKYGLMSIDSFYFPVQGFKLKDIYALPKRGILVDFVDGRFQISRAGGHVHFYWIKSGLLFRLGAAGYALVGLLNGAPGNLVIAGAVFIGGLLMKKMYSPVYRLGGKYKIVRFTN